jgi:hypothetical protein
MKTFALAASTLLAGLSCVAAPLKSAHLTLVSAQIVPGNLLGLEAVTSDRFYAYCATYQGTLFVLDKSKKGFPVLATLAASELPLHAVRSDGQSIYVTDAGGTLSVFSATKPFAHLASLQLSAYGLDSLFVDQTTVIVARGEGEMAANGSVVCLAQLNPGDTAVVLNKATLSQTGELGQTFEDGVTTVFDRSNGHQIHGIPDPINRLGQTNQPALYLNNGILLQTILGPYGTGVAFSQPSTGASLGFLPWPSANAAIELQCGLLAVGTEAGTVSLFDSNGKLLSTINLRRLTGHTGPEAIEIRTLWEDPWTGDIYAGSSWSDLTAPSFFVLRVITRPLSNF